MVASDLCIVCMTFFLCLLIKKQSNSFYNLNTYLILLPVLLFIWGGLLYCFGMYSSFRTRRISHVIFIVVEAAIVGCSLFGGFIFITKMNFVSRLYIVYLFLLAATFISIEKYLLIQFFRYQRKRGFNIRNILIVGTGSRAQHLIGLIKRHPEWGVRVIGLVDNDITKVNTMVCGYKVIGSFDDITDIIHNAVVDEVIFVVPRSWLSDIEKTISGCEIEGIRVSIALDLFDLKLSKSKYSSLEKFPLLSFESTPDKQIHLFLKRVFDFVFSSVALVISSPIFAVAAILIKTTSKGDVFFKQQRCSLNGRRFTIYKFRTMVQDAESKLAELLACNEMNGPVFKMEKDPRVTKVGKILRKLSIDELPQLWCVFKGDMSLVGPRPPIPLEVSQYEPWQRRRLSMRPGLTCIWQVCGRNKITDFNEWMKLDLMYIDNWSLWLDCKILLKTLPAVLLGTGAK
ncbi:MAG: sugar transferase [wastewater metagenome]|nr:sugar transferase [Candidatus Loosdrechtia aerotolerans]